MEELPSWDWTVIAGAVCLVLGVILTKGTDALLKLRKSNMDADAQDDAGKVAGYKMAIEQLQKLLAAVEAERIATLQQHLECVKTTGILTGKVDILITQNDKLVREVADLREHLNMVERHGQKTLEQVAEHLKSMEKMDKALHDSGVLDIPHGGPPNA